MRNLLVLFAFLILSFSSSYASEELEDEQKITCPSGDTETCVVLKDGDTTLGTVKKGKGGIKGEVIN